MKSSADTGDFAKTVTVQPPTGNYVTSLFHPGAQYLYYGLKKKKKGPDHTGIMGADKHAQTIKFTHRKCCAHTPIHPSSYCRVTHGETGYFRPAETETVIHTWNSLVPLWIKALSVPDRVHACVCVCAYVCVYVQEQLLLGPWEMRLYRTPTSNHSCVLVFLSITHMCFQDPSVRVTDRTERAITREGGRN